MGSMACPAIYEGCRGNSRRAVAWIEMAKEPR
jgi:hypothetical protein